MTRNCDACGKPYETQSRRSKYCTDPECKVVRERKRSRVRRSGATVTELHPPAPAADELGVVAKATFDALVAAGRLETPAGWNVMVIARRLDVSSGDTGSSTAALSKQHLAALAEATRDAAQEADRIDELGQRRRLRHA